MSERLRQVLAHLEEQPVTRRSVVAQAKGNRTAADAALLAVGNATEATGERWATSDEVRQFGLTVAYAIVEAALNEEPTLPACFTADDLVIASDVLAGEMSRGVGR